MVGRRLAGQSKTNSEKRLTTFGRLSGTVERLILDESAAVFSDSFSIVGYTEVRQPQLLS